VEDSGTFVGNARKKARALWERLPAGSWALADDSGLCVDALNGGPGVESAYFAGPQGDGAANLAKLVTVMREVPQGSRGAKFVCVLLVCGPGGEEKIFEGESAGQLDPLFVPAGHEHSFSELGDAAKAGISHRARAWARLAEWVRGGA
jgi:XTP/dITP diphosphohydrolase